MLKQQQVELKLPPTQWLEKSKQLDGGQVDFCSTQPCPCPCPSGERESERAAGAGANRRAVAYSGRLTGGGGGERDVSLGVGGLP